MRDDAVESRLAIHSLQLAEGVGIAGRGAGQHDEAEGGGQGRRNAILVRHEFERRRAAAGLQRRVYLLQQSSAGGRVEVMQKVGEQDDIVRPSVRDIEGAARQ